MALQEKTVIDKIEILEDGQVQVRTATVILRDGKEISRLYAREVLVPGQDVSAKDAKVQAVTPAIWTVQVIKDYNDAKKVQQTGLADTLLSESVTK